MQRGPTDTDHQPLSLATDDFITSRTAENENQALEFVSYDSGFRILVFDRSISKLLLELYTLLVLLPLETIKRKRCDVWFPGFI